MFQEARAIEGDTASYRAARRSHILQWMASA